MKTHLLLVGIALLLMPQLNFAQTPNLGTAASFSFFTSVGAFGNTGATYITGDIGTNSGALTGFPPGTVVGQTHIANATSMQAAIDVDVAYNYLSGLTCGTSIGTALGNNQTLTPNIYCLGAASTLNGNLILDGQGNANAVFIFKIDGALTTSISSTITLINSASLNNVYWQITGAVVLGESSVFKGTIIGNAAISLLESATLTGRGLTKQGAISLHNNNISPVLFIGLLYFTGQKQDKGVLVNWATASALNGVQIDVQKSFNARDFQTIATFKDYETATKNVYSFLDNTPFNGINNSLFNTVYYRLKQIDANHTFEYSKVIAVVKEAREKAFIYPNPTSYQITAKNILSPQVFSITDVVGKVMMTGQLNEAEALDIRRLPAGFYTLNVQSISIRFLKN
jgi:Ice-binding-like/Secretion system C-terminal sorting domain